MSGEGVGGRTLRGTRSGVVAEVARQLLPRLGELEQRSLRRTRDQDEAYRVLVDADDPEAGRYGVAFVLRQLGGTAVDAELKATPESIGRTRAEQGVPLEAVLHAFRIDFLVVWEAMLELVRNEDEHTLRPFLEGATRVWETIDSASQRVSVAYREAEADIARQRRERHALLLGALLRGTGPVTAVSQQVATELGVTESGSFALVFAEPLADRQAALSNPEATLARVRLRSGWRTDATGQVGLVALAGHTLNDVVEPLGPVARGRVGLSPAFHPLAAARDHVWLAEAAARTVAVGTAGVAVLDRCLPSALVASSPDLARHLACTVLAGLYELPETERDRLVGALRAYVESSGSVAATATRMHLHRNTLFGYLRRIHEVTGRDPNNPGQVTELVLALEAVRVHGPP